MQLVVRTAGLEREVDLQLDTPDATVADLVAAVDPTASHRTRVTVDGRPVAPDTSLVDAGLAEGAVVAVGDEPAAAPRRPCTDRPVVAVLGGPDAGGSVPLDDELTVGRGPSCGLVVADPSVSWEHARFTRAPDGTVVVGDLGSSNGTWVDGRPVLPGTAVPAADGALIRLGATQLRVRPGEPDDRPLTSDRPALRGLAPFNRPPRPAPPAPPNPVPAPPAPTASSRARAFSIVSVIAPLLMGAVLIWIYRNPRFALFFLLSPLMAVGNWLASRRQARKDRRVSAREFQRALADLDRQLAAAVAGERRRLDEVVPDPAEVVRRAQLPSVRLWQRRLDHGDALQLRVGVGDVPWEPPLTAPRGERPAEVEEVVDRHRRLPAAPVTVDLSGGKVVGLVGDREAALALARSLVCQAAVHHGPADLEMAILAAPAHAPAWDWAKWLPHVRDPAGHGRLLAGDRDAAEALLAELLDGPGAGGDRRDGRHPPGRTRLLVLDDVALTEGRRAPARRLLQGVAGPAAGIVVATSEDQLPAVCTTVVDLGSDLGDGVVRRPQEAVRIDAVLACGVGEPTARCLARALARYEDPELDTPGTGLPTLVRLLPLLGVDDPDADAVLRGWKQGGPDLRPATPIGLGEDGVVELDLVRDGPHALVGGTTGSGKSELLRSLVAGLAARVDPDHLVFVLVDYKGGSAFDRCAELPHTVGSVTDLDEHLGERALRSLEAELRHRERLLRDAGAADLPEYLAAGAPSGPLPRLLVVIDEFATLAAELPDFLGALVGIAQRGRSLGVHLVLATQRPSGAVNANIKANTNLRVALRVQSAADSIDIIDRPDAAELGRAQPGRAYLRRGAGDVVLVQTALSTAPAPATAGLRLVPFGFGPSTSPPAATNDSDEPDLDRLVRAARQAFDRSGAAPPRRPWLPMLADHLPLGEVLAAAPPGPAVPFALADDPDRQAQQPVGWSLDDGHFAVFGMVGSGTTTTLRALARALAECHHPDRLHLYALDFGAGELADVAALPQHR